MVTAAATSGAGMDRGDLKRLLRLAREEPVQAAIALSADGKAVVQLDRRKPGRALEKQIREEAPGSKNHCWGTASIDMDDPKLVRFTLNKAPGGIARRLVVALKGTGHSKVKLQLEDGTELESHEEPDETTEPEAAVRELASAEITESKPPAPPAATELAALTQDLTNLVKQAIAAIAADPARKGTLGKLAADAQTRLKSGDAGAAKAAIDALRAAVASGAAQADSGVGPAHASAATTEKARQVWVATRAKIGSEIDKLHGALAAAAQGHEREGDITQSVRGKLDTVLDQLDDTLTHTLEALGKTPHGPERDKLVEQAHGLVKRYQGHLESDPVIAALDRNPFLPMSIGKTLTATLAALSKSIV